MLFRKINIPQFSIAILFSVVGTISFSQDYLLSPSEKENLNNDFIDSLKHRIMLVNEDIEKVNTLGKITDYYRENQNIDSSYHYFLKTISSVKKMKDFKLQADIVLEFDILFIYTNNFSNAISVHEELIEHETEINSQENMFFLHSRSGYFNESIGRIKPATENYFLALNYAEILNDDLKKAQMFNNIGNAYISIEEFSEAQNYIQKGIEICEKNKDINIPILYNNLAKVHEFNKDTIAAISNFRKCLTNADGPDAIITASINLSDIWIAKELMDSARFYSELALSEARLLGEISPQLVRSQFQISKVCQLAEDYACQLSYLDSSYSRAKSLSLLIELEVISHELSLYHEKNGKPSLALSYIRENIAYNDSINLQETQSILFNKKEERNLDSLKFASFKLESEKNLLTVKVSRRNSVLALTSFLAITLILLVILFYRNVQRKKRILELELKEKDATIISKNKEILSANLEIEAQESALSDIRNKLKEELSSEYDSEFNELNVVLKQANRSLSKLERRKYVNEIIKSTDSNFHKTLKDKFPELTIGELKMMTLIRLNLGTEELTEIFNISRDSLNKKRYRIRKKMNLSKDQDLDEEIRAIF